MSHPGSTSSFTLKFNEYYDGPGKKTNSTRRPQASPSKRPTSDQFRELVLAPREHEALLREYVGTDSKYTLAKNHAGMMVRSSIKSQDLASKMLEVAEPLNAIDNFLGFLLEHQVLKQEQKGCVSLRICYGALTALLGDFSHSGCVENFVSDPHAAVVPREQLGQFRSFNPILHEILYRLAAKLEKSLNLYRHRRSPSGTLVAKFQDMSDTLEVWNRHLMDDTFATPSRIVSDWLKNHPQQVDSRRRNQAYSEEVSPNLLDTGSPLAQRDSNYLLPMSAYGEPSRHSNKPSVRPTAMDDIYQNESLFKPTSAVSFFGPNSMTPSPVQYRPNLYRTSGFEGNMNLPTLADLDAFASIQATPSTQGEDKAGAKSNTTVGTS